MGCNPNLNKTPASLSVFAKRKPAFKVRIDSLRAKGTVSASASAGPGNCLRKAKKSVRFGESKVLFRHAPESEATWYQPGDYEAFKKDSKSTLNALQQAQGNIAHLDGNDHCLRGLEAHVSSDVLRLRQMRIRSTVQVVLDQQKVQRVHGVSDPNMIGAVSMMFSRKSRQHALSMGALDNSFRWFL